MCGKSAVAVSAAAVSASSLSNQNQTNSTQFINIATAEMRMDDYFFLDPLFIIGMLVLFVVSFQLRSWHNSENEDRDCFTESVVSKRFQIVAFSRSLL